MKSLWDNKKAKEFKTDLDIRVYTSQLLGRNSSLVLHGGGNTSVKTTITNIFGEKEDILYVKGSGWDLETIQTAGFAPVKMDMLLKMAKLKNLSDTDMVKYQRMAMIEPLAPNPSVEAILHAIIPFKYVDHTHSDAIVTITNTKNPQAKIKEIYGKNMLIIPYIMPGFVLAKLVYDMTRGINWNKLDGMVLLNHGLFTFDNDAKKSYEKTINLVDKAEKYLLKNKAKIKLKTKKSTISTLELAKIRQQVSILKKQPVISTFNDNDMAICFASQKNLNTISQKAPLTPDHVIRTKRIPVILNKNYKKELKKYIKEYKRYFKQYNNGQILLNPIPNMAIIKNQGSLSFGVSAKECDIIKDINNHTFEAILKAQKLGGYNALSKKDIFDVEYWELEQAKLKKNKTTQLLSGKIAIVTKSNNSMEIATKLNDNGCAVVMLDEIKSDKIDLIGVKCNTDLKTDLQKVTNLIIKKFGGIDMIVTKVPLDTNSKLLKYTKPYLKLGIEPIVTTYDKLKASLC